MIFFKNIHILVFGLFGIAFFSFASDSKSVATEDIKKINEAYEKYKAISFKMSYELYSGPESNVLVEKHEGAVKKKGTLFLGNYYNGTVLQNDSMQINVDPANKRIVIQRISGKSNTMAAMVPDISKALSQCSSIDFQKLSATLSKYIFSYKSGNYKKMEIVFNTKTYLLEKAIFFYGSKVSAGKNGIQGYPKLVIGCSEIKPNAKLTTKDFSINKYVSKVNNRYIAQKGFKNYQVINQM